MIKKVILISTLFAAISLSGCEQAVKDFFEPGGWEIRCAKEKGVGTVEFANCVNDFCGSDERCKANLYRSNNLKP